MDIKLIYEIIGYTASALILISMLMSSVLRLRIVNLVGAIFFTAYGLLIGAYPIALVNFIIIGINAYYLYQILTAKEYFDLVEVRPTSQYLMLFLKVHAKEIKHFLPDFSYLPTDTTLVFFMLRDMMPAGLFIAEPRGGGALWVHLDFVIPGFRDFKIGHYLYTQKAGFFKEKGLRKIFSPSGNPAHANYLRQMGFTPDSSDSSGALYSRTID